MRALLVDDHEIVRRGLKQLLAEAFPDTVFGEAETAPGAREQLAAESWDLVVLDINLPGASGLVLLSEIAAGPTRPAVLILSAYSEREFAVQALKAGADGFLTKNSVADELLVAVRKVLGGGKYVSASLAEELAFSLSAETHTSHETLSMRELEVLRMVAVGKTIKSIAAELSLSEKTIATYRTRVSRKLGLSTNVELARYALKHGLAE